MVRAAFRLNALSRAHPPRPDKGHQPQRAGATSLSLTPNTLLAHADLRGPVDPLVHGEKDAKLTQKLGQLQPFVPVFPPEYMGQLASFGPT